jgi:WD40 repeat protein
MPKPRPPSSVKTITFPVFGLTWCAGADQSSIVAYCGGGGSAKTGVSNKIVVQVEDDDTVIDTGDQVCVALVAYQDPISNQKWLLGAMGNFVHRYQLPTCDKAGSVEVGGGCNALAVHCMAQVFAVGCDDGLVHIYQFTTTNEEPWQKLFTCTGHEKSVCSLQFALRSDWIISSSKDGTARVWKQGGDCLGILECDISDPDEKTKPKKPPQVLVRGCAFGDLEGKVVYTVASGRKGKAFASKWLFTNEKFQLEVRTPIHTYPISAMNLSSDGSLLALGGVDGTVLLVSVGEWKVLKKFVELHELPVTGIAARPVPLPLQGDGEVQWHALSASADSQMGLLTLETKVPRKAKAASSKTSNSAFSLSLLIWCVLVLSFLYQFLEETYTMCSQDWSLTCVYRIVLIAPLTRPGILVPPH